MPPEPAAPNTAPPAPPAPPPSQSTPPAQRPSSAVSNAEYHHMTVDERIAFDNRRAAERDARDAPRRADAPPGDDRTPGDQPPAEPTTPATVKIGELNLTEQDIRGLMERSALEESRRLTVPATAADYKLELPKDFVAPQGIEFKFNENDPAIAYARQFAVENGLTQDQFSKLASIYASTKVSELQTLQKVLNAEIQKLGPSGAPRVTAIQTFLRGQLGDDLGKIFSTLLVSEPIVRGWEKIMAGYRGQGSHGYTQGNREPPEPQGRVSEEQFSRMSHAERMDYARQFPQAKIR